MQTITWPWVVLSVALMAYALIFCWMVLRKF